MLCLLDAWFKTGLEGDENERIMRGPKSESEQMYMPLVYTDILHEIDADLTYGDFSRVSEWVDMLLSGRGLKLDPDSLSYRTLCHDMLKIQLRLYKIRLAREEGDYDYELPFTKQFGHIQANEPPTETIREVINQYVSEAEANWTAKSKAEIVDDSLTLLEDVMGT